MQVIISPPHRRGQERLNLVGIIMFSYSKVRLYRGTSYGNVMAAPEMVILQKFVELLGLDTIELLDILIDMSKPVSNRSRNLWCESNKLRCSSNLMPCTIDGNNDSTSIYCLLIIHTLVQKYIIQKNIYIHN